MTMSDQPPKRLSSRDIELLERVADLLESQRNELKLIRFRVGCLIWALVVIGLLILGSHS